MYVCSLFIQNLFILMLLCHKRSLSPVCADFIIWWTHFTIQLALDAVIRNTGIEIFKYVKKKNKDVLSYVITLCAFELWIQLEHGWIPEFIKKDFVLNREPLPSQGCQKFKSWIFLHFVYANRLVKHGILTQNNEWKV